MVPHGPINLTHKIDHHNHTEKGQVGNEKPEPRQGQERKPRVVGKANLKRGKWSFSVRTWDKGWRGYHPEVFQIQWESPVSFQSHLLNWTGLIGFLFLTAKPHYGYHWIVLGHPIVPCFRPAINQVINHLECPLLPCYMTLYPWFVDNSHSWFWLRTSHHMQLK